MENTISKRESNTYLDRVNDLFDEMDNNFTEASQKVSMCDLQQEDILHYIEFYGDKLSVKKKTELFDLLFEVRSAPKGKVYFRCSPTGNREVKNWFS